MNNSFQLILVHPITPSSSSDKQAFLQRQRQINRDIHTIRSRLEKLSEIEYTLKQQFKNITRVFVVEEDEENELKLFKRQLLHQVESLLYLDQHMIFDPGRLTIRIIRIILHDIYN